MTQTATDAPTRDAIVERALQFWQRQLVSLGTSAASARAATARGTERWISAQSWGQGLEIVLANGRALEDAAMPDTATGDDLDRICAIYGLTRSAGAGAQGNVTVTCTGSVTYVTGQELVSDTTGKRYRVVTSTTTTTGGSVAVVGIDVGTATDLDAGESLTWTSPPSGSATTCVVASGGLVDGADADNDGRLRERLLKLLREPQNGGSWAHYRQWAEDASSAVEDAFVYPAAQGPGTVHLAYTIEGDADNRYARAGTTALTTLVNDAVIAEQPEYADVTVTTVAHQDTGVALKITIPEPLTGGGQGGGWIDPVSPGTPVRWPTAKIGAGNVDGVVKVTAVTSSTAFTVNANVAPTAGVTILFFSTTDRVFYEAEVVTVGGSAGARTITIDRALPTVAVDDYVSPACEQYEAYGETFMAEVAKLAPGEKTSDADVLPRAFRRPATEDGFPSALTTRLVSTMQTSHTEISNAAFFMIDESPAELPFEPDPPSPVTDPPQVLRIAGLALYPTD
jgi:hypothetical protein